MAPMRTMRPVYVDRLPPCNHACPAGENIQAWLAEAQAGRHREAWEIIVRDNPLPAVHGRVCYHPCEDACNRADIDDAVSIHAVERFLGDMALSQGWTVAPDAPPSGQRVLVVGAGPSGLSAAWHLALGGHHVVIHEAGPLAGGMMHFGIPTYRLPRAVLDAEIERIRRVGVEIVLNHKVDRSRDREERAGDSTRCSSPSAHTSASGRRFRRAMPARSMTRCSSCRTSRPAARSRASAGVSPFTAAATRRWTRRGRPRGSGPSRSSSTAATRDQMPAHDFEADEAIEEGVKIHWLRTIKAIDGTTLTVEVMRLDENRSPHQPASSRRSKRTP